MSEKFSGFPPGKARHTQVPAPFFSDLLPLIDDLAELKVTLFCLWALPQKEGKYRFLTRRDFANDESLIQGLSVTGAASAEVALEAALLRAIERGTLFCIEFQGEKLYLMNTAQGREAVRQFHAGTWQPDRGSAVEIMPERPNIYALYEAEIGMITLTTAELLKEAEKEYPAEWIAEAIRIAVEGNKRNWRYVKALLKRWQTEGKDHEEDRRYAQRDEQRRLIKKASDFIQQ